MEPALLLLALPIALLRVLSRRLDRRARATVARALSGMPSQTEARFARYPSGRWGR
jgi:hypothetical protein